MTIDDRSGGACSFEGVLGKYDTFCESLKTAQKNRKKIEDVSSLIFSLKEQYMDLQNNGANNLTDLSYFQRKKIHKKLAQADKLYQKVIPQLEKYVKVEDKPLQLVKLDDYEEQDNLFSTLPNEVKYMIFSYLNIDELPKKMIVCKQWYHLIRDTIFLTELPKKYSGKYPPSVKTVDQRTRYNFLYLRVHKAAKAIGIDDEIPLGTYIPNRIPEFIKKSNAQGLKDYLEYGKQTVGNIETSVLCSTIWNLEQAYCSPLHYAVYLLDIEAVKVIIECGMDVNIKNIHQYTPLMCICDQRYWNHPNKTAQLQIVRLLIDNGADVNVTNANGDNVLDIAEKHKNHDLSSYLLKKGLAPKIDKDSFVKDTLGLAFGKFF